METKKDWFERWPEPRGLADCPPESKLVEWASEPDGSEAKSHLAQCSKCAEIVEMVGQSANSSSESLYAFMNDVRKRAQQEAEQRVSLRRTWVNYVFASPARAVGAAAGAGALLLMVTSGVWRHLGILRPPPQTQAIRMDLDSNEQSFAVAMEKLRQSYTTMSGGNVDKDQAAREVVEVNLAVAKVDKDRLPSEQRLQLDSLQARYHALVSGDVEKNINSYGKDYVAMGAKPPTIRKVQTGGFGDSNGLKGEGKQGTKPPGLATGSLYMSPSGGAKGIKGTMASADFGNRIATGSNDGSGTGQLAPVEITYKPNPVYTDEARSLKLEGEVLLEVTFSADGTLHVNRVVRGLGHGLDEAAVAAANKMRFKPAMRNGQPINSTAVVHIVFQMAY